MIAALRTNWADIIHGLWFRPGLIVLGSGVLAAFTLFLDSNVPIPEVLAFGGDASAARSVLSTIATSLMTVAGVSLSLTVVTLQLVAAQLSPRAVRGLLSDRQTHLSIGGLFGIFLFCLLVMRAVRGADTGEFVPRLSVTVAIALAVVGLGLLLMFVHRVAVAIRASNIAAEIANETIAAIDKLCPDQYGGPPPGIEETLAAWRREGDGARYTSHRPGYVQSIDLDGLRKAARGHRVAVLARPGDFVGPSDTMVEMWPAPSDRSGMERTVSQTVHVANERDLEQDPGYGIRQLVDVALRALSPAVNDPSTAVTCIAYVGVILERLAAPAYPPEMIGAEDGKEVALVRGRSFDEHLSALAALRPGTDPRVRDAIERALAAGRESAARVGAEERVAAVDRMAAHLARVSPGDGI